MIITPCLSQQATNYIVIIKSENWDPVVLAGYYVNMSDNFFVICMALTGQKIAF